MDLMGKVIIRKRKKTTYQKIKEYVKDKYDVNVHTSYIVEDKWLCGLEVGENYINPKKKIQM